jgi:hypothetical protein
MRPDIVLISTQNALVARNEPVDSNPRIHSPYASIALKDLNSLFESLSASHNERGKPTYLVVKPDN